MKQITVLFVIELDYRKIVAKLSRLVNFVDETVVAD